MGTAEGSSLSGKAVPLNVERLGLLEAGSPRRTIQLCRVPFPRRAARRGRDLRVPLVRSTTSLVAYEPRFWLAISPLVVTYMLRYFSGVPVLERRYEDDDTYAAYRRRTNAMLPWPPRRN